MSIEQNLLRSNAYFAALMLKIMKQLILLNGLVLKKMYQFIPRPSPLPPGAGEKRFLPLSPSLRGIKGEGAVRWRVLNYYNKQNQSMFYLKDPVFSPRFFPWHDFFAILLFFDDYRTSTQTAPAYPCIPTDEYIVGIPINYH